VGDETLADEEDVASGPAAGVDALAVEGRDAEAVGLQHLAEVAEVGVRALAAEVGLREHIVDDAAGERLQLVALDVIFRRSRRAMPLALM
jgi:hypothetical protein